MPEVREAPARARAQRCGPCLERDAAAGRARDARLRAAGIPRRDPGKACIAERRRRERQIAARRVAGLCAECGKEPPAPGRTVCEPCARRSYHRSQHFRRLALYPPQYTVVALSTGADHSAFDSWDEVALCLAFARLSLDEVEVLTDQSPMATLTAARE